MGSQGVTGKSGKVEIGAEVVDIRNWDIAQPVDAVETTSMSSGGNGEFAVGISRWSGSFETLDWVDLSGTQTVGSFYTGAAATASTPVFAGTVIVTDAGIAVPYDGVVAYRHTFQGSGPLAVTVA